MSENGCASCNVPCSGQGKSEPVCESYRGPRPEPTQDEPTIEELILATREARKDGPRG